MILIVIFLNSSAGSRDIRSRPSWKGHTKATIQDAVKEKLYNRGEGKG
jgi:hypothetical protein